jgi:acetyl esterase/lipase
VVCPLWDGPAPFSVGEEAADVPTYQLYEVAAPSASGVGVVVLPGGGYIAHADHEAAPVGRWLRSNGIEAMVVLYRLAPRYKHPAMLTDAQHAVVRLRELGAERGVRKIGILGFSAGGHLAGMTALLDEERSVPRSRPDFGVLIYPVVAMVGPLAHEGCRASLLGTAEETLQAEQVSLDRNVRAGAPPLFVVHGANDEVVNVGNSLALADAYRRASASCELHVFADGVHGFGLGDSGRPNSAWPDLCISWIRSLD